MQFLKDGVQTVVQNPHVFLSVQTEIFSPKTILNEGEMF